MAKQFTKKKGEVKPSSYPSRFGSHRSMVVASDLETRGRHVLCRDGGGVYQTSADRLDSGLADPNRYSGR